MTYLTSESGAVTVDWVVLTAGLVGLGLATMAVVSTGVQDTSTDVQEQLTGQTIATTFAAFAGNPHGTIGFAVLNQASYDYHATTYSGASVETLHADYLTDSEYVAAFIASGDGGWGPGIAHPYHRMGAIAAELEAQGAPLPPGAMLASDATAQLAAVNTSFAAQL